VVAFSFDKIIGKSPQMERLFQILPVIAQSGSSVLITGETGTGKDLLAESIHQNSERSKGPFIKINCGALPDSLLESELFGYVRGAFTDAKQDKPGRFQLADRGTLFLDEIGDISPAMQVKLLRVLQEGTFEPLGSTQTYHADVRIIAATSRDLPSLIEMGQFRQDLYYRINVMTIDIPPLRERKEDIPLLIDHYMQQLNHSTGKSIRSVSADTMKVLLNYEYPGNVRELQNILEHAFVLCKEAELTMPCLPSFLATPPAIPAQTTLEPSSQLRDAEMQIILETLQQHHGNKTQAAKALGIDRTTLWRKLKQHRPSSE
jgi:transcriptional regulator with PAS, ATPase and Fis domain